MCKAAYIPGDLLNSSLQVYTGLQNTFSDQSEQVSLLVSALPQRERPQQRGNIQVCRHGRLHSLSGVSESRPLCSRLALMQCGCVAVKNCMIIGWEVPFPEPLSYSGVLILLSLLPLVLGLTTLQLCLWLYMNFTDPELI